MNKFWLPLFALAALSLPAFAQQDDTVVEEIVARVNNSIITREDLRRGREQMLRELREQKPNASQSDVEAREKDNLRDLIDQQLLIQKAADLGISADVETVKRLEELRLQMGAKDMEELQKMAEAEGVSWEEFKQNTKNGILTQKVISQEVSSRISVTREEEHKYYEEHKAELDQPETVRLSEILIAAIPNEPNEQDSKAGKMAPQATPEQIAAAKEKADELFEKLKSGAKFDDLARQYSNGPTAQQGGDLGYFKRGTLAKEIENQTFSLKAGQNTGVIQTKQGFLILKVLDHTQAGLPPFDKIEPQIQEQLYMHRIQPELRKYLTKLREDAYIDIKPGFVDTGASANQTKLVYTNAPATADKNKAKKGKGSKKNMGQFEKGKKSGQQDTTQTAQNNTPPNPVESQGSSSTASQPVPKHKLTKEEKKQQAAEKKRLEKEKKEHLKHLSKEERKAEEKKDKELKKQEKIEEKEAKKEAKKQKEQQEQQEGKKKHKRFIFF